MPTGDAGGAAPKLMIRNLEKYYSIDEGFGRTTRVHALKNINFDVDDGELLTIIGPSGCGKTTLLMAVAGIHSIDGGAIMLDGRPIGEPGLDRGIVFQDFALFPWMTVANNVRFGLRNKGGYSTAEQQKITAKYLKLVGLQDFADVYPHRLSGGMKQRVGIARALAPDPAILLMDEPFGALDAQTRKSLQRQLLEIWRLSGKTILFVTHSVREAVFLSRRVVVLSSRPGQIAEIVDIDLSFEDRMSAAVDLLTYERQIERLIENQVFADDIGGLQPSSFH